MNEIRKARCCFRRGRIDGVCKNVCFALLVVLAPVAQARAGDLWLTATVGSHHFTSHHYCEFNPGVGAEWQAAEKFRLVGGTYKNSLCRQSFYAGALVPLVRWDHASFALQIGGISGYDHSIAVYPVPTFVYERGRYGINVVAAPKTQESPGVVSFQLKYNL